MTDYISRQAAIEDFTAWQKDLAYGFGEEYSGVALLKTAVTVIEHYPAADVVEVVRCKDCKWYNKSGCAIYIADDTDKPTDNDFCSYGERADR